MSSEARMNSYFRTVAILAFLGIFLVLFSIITVVYVAPVAHSVAYLSIAGLLDLLVLVLTINHKFTGLVLAFAMNLYGLLRAQQTGVVYDALHFNASFLTYLGLALMLLTLIVSGLALMVYFKRA